MRVLQLGDEVTKSAPSKGRRTDGVTPMQEGPYLVTEVLSGSDYMVQRMGTKHQPVRAHIDQLQLLRREIQEEAGSSDGEGEKAPAKPHAKSYAIRKIVGEKGNTRRSKQWKVLWEDDDTTSWEPAANLDYAPGKIKEWTELTAKQQHELMNMSNAQLREKFMNETDTRVTTAAATMVMDSCSKRSQQEEAISGIQRVTQANLVAMQT